MLKYNIKNLMKLRGITHPSAYLLKNGFSRNVAVRIAAEKMTAISPSQIEKLCNILKCLPNDLFLWIPGKDETATERHPLWKIREKEIKSVTELGNEIHAENFPDFIEKVKLLEEGIKG